MKKEIVIRWEEGLKNVEVSFPKTETLTAEIVGVLEMSKMIAFEKRKLKEE